MIITLIIIYIIGAIVSGFIHGFIVNTISEMLACAIFWPILFIKHLIFGLLYVLKRNDTKWL